MTLRIYSFVFLYNVFLISFLLLFFILFVNIFNIMLLLLLQVEDAYL